MILGQGADTPQAVGQLESLRAAGKTQHDKKEKKVCERERRKERERAKEHPRRWGGMERARNLEHKMQVCIPALPSR